MAQPDNKLVISLGDSHLMPICRPCNHICNLQARSLSHNSRSDTSNVSPLILGIVVEPCAISFRLNDFLERFPLVEVVMPLVIQALIVLEIPSTDLTNARRGNNVGGRI